MDDERCELILNVATEGFWDWDVVRDEVYLSPRYCELIGYPADDAPFDSSFFRSIIFPGDRERVFAVHEERLQGKSHASVTEYRIITRDGTVLWIEGRGKVVACDERGMPSRIVGTIVDIGDRKKAEESLSQSQKLLSSIVEHAPYAFFVKDAADQFRVVLWNRTAELIFGIPACAIIGKNAHDLRPGEQADAFLADDLTVVASRAMSDIPSEASVHSEQGTIYLHTRKVPLMDESGAVTSIVVISEDITFRKRGEDQIRTLNAGLEDRVLTRTAELQAAVRELESFCYSVSHDLRAPLRHINSFSAILTEEYGGELPGGGARHYLERIGDTTRRMGDLIDHLLGAWNSPSKRGCWSGELLAQLPGNLLDNAWKYSSGRALARIEFGRAKTEGVESFFVKDNGSGFDMAYQERLFEVFPRLHGAEFDALGIGLATAQRSVQRHKGAIWAQGKVDEGATFYFTP